MRFAVARCSLLAALRSLFPVCCLLLGVRLFACVLLGVSDCCWLFGVCCLLCVVSVRCLLFPLFPVGGLLFLFVFCFLFLFVVMCLLFVV